MANTKAQSRGSLASGEVTYGNLLQDVRRDEIPFRSSENHPSWGDIFAAPYKGYVL